MQNELSLITGQYYVIDVDTKFPAINGFPNFIHKYSLQNVVVKFVDAYNTNNKVSYVFEHTIPKAHYMFYGVWTLIASNHTSQEDFNRWTTHIYKERFVVKKNITNLVLKCISKFKQLLENKKLKVLCSLKKTGLDNDVNIEIFKKMYNI